jgi:hypothetical protein
MMVRQEAIQIGGGAEGRREFKTWNAAELRAFLGGIKG